MHDLVRVAKRCFDFVKVDITRQCVEYRPDTSGKNQTCCICPGNGYCDDFIGCLESRLWIPSIRNTICVAEIPKVNIGIGRPPMCSESVASDTSIMKLLVTHRESSTAKKTSN